MNLFKKVAATIEEHYENFMSQPDVEKYVELYCSIFENTTKKYYNTFMIDYEKLSKEHDANFY